MQLLYVPLRRDALERLVELAQAEHRRPQDQAAWLLERALVTKPAAAGQGEVRNAN